LRFTSSFGLAVSFAFASASARSARTSGVRKRSTCERTVWEGVGCADTDASGANTSTTSENVRIVIGLTQECGGENAKILTNDDHVREHPVVVTKSPGVALRQGNARA